MRKPILVALGLLLASLAALAQPSNDDCTNPIPITDVTNYCSAANAFTSAGATVSGYGAANCFGTAGNDVWFSFVPQFTDVTVIIRGATTQGPGGTLQDPLVALYYGSCGGVLNEVQCQSAVGNSNIVEASESGLLVGSTYLIRVQGAANGTGSFQLCLNNYNPPVEPTSDCPTASVLCDKSPFVVQSVTGAGSNISELNDATCFSNGAPGNFESNSTWFTWICAQSGTLEFTLTPLNIADDLDFVLYRLPNGPGNCQGKQVVRCMASGEFNYLSPCMGPTGLRPGDSDTSEDAGCTDNGDNAWLSPFDMVAGETYALCVNNFTTSGNGFSIQFGGTGTFLGPEARFTTVPAAVCLGTAVQVQDASTFALGNVTAWNWSFGADSNPGTATGQGPHTVTFNTSGQHPVVLQVETNLGCRVTAIQNVLVYPDVEVDTLIAAPECNGGDNGAITINNIKMGTPPYLFSWEGGPFTPTSSLTGLTVGTYNLVIRDANNCETELDIEVRELELTVAPVVTKPLCTGDANGVITLNVTNGTGPYQFDWGAGFIPQNTQGGFAAGAYTIYGVDAELCKGTFTVQVPDNPPVTLQMDTVDISCFGANDGIGIALAGGGVGNFTYLWSDSQANEEASSLGPGQYAVTVSDGNGCTITGAVFITEPPDVGINLLRVLNLLCNGVPEGSVEVEGVGGRPPFTFSADGVNFTPAGTLTGLAAGDYWIKIRDAAGCVDSVQATLTEPPPLVVVAEPADTALDLGYSVRITTNTFPFGRPVSFAWTPPLGLSCEGCPEPTVTAINDGFYIVKITDEDGCMAFDTVRILVRRNRPIYVPNVFAPDKPFPNDHFTLFGGPAAVSIQLLRIYDRWGSLVFETRDIPLGEPNYGWDGTYKGELMSGVFAFYATVLFVDQQELTYEGNVTVVR
ncbi:MAG: gliding motility-associated C-terminal domain-containing protein [Saprospirales bacterium]|nr:gliding motility-associated C-terminal domain-containing protein [Saprospirales bacterium]MBK8920638.1 gliding motility-associated C-terminal domain-containing protein [Saprospirales bacterium]